MNSITLDEMSNIKAGAEALECFFAGVIFGAAIGTGNILAAAGSGLYIASNCF
jgi:hypothetical protein